MRLQTEDRTNDSRGDASTKPITNGAERMYNKNPPPTSSLVKHLAQATPKDSWESPRLTINISQSKILKNFTEKKCRIPIQGFVEKIQEEPTEERPFLGDIIWGL